jgi:hypothetical protein
VKIVDFNRYLFKGMYLNNKKQIVFWKISTKYAQLYTYRLGLQKSYRIIIMLIIKRINNTIVLVLKRGENFRLF